MQYYLINIRPKLHHRKWWKLHVTLPGNMSTVPNFSTSPLMLFFVQPLSGNCYKLPRIVNFTFITYRFLIKILSFFWTTSKLPRLLDTASKFAIFSVSGLKNEKLIKKVNKHENWNIQTLFYRLLNTVFLPNMIKIDPYNFEL